MAVSWIRGIVVLASLATGAVAIWLLAVIAFVLPSRDPAHVPMWTGVAVSLAVYASLCLGSVTFGAGRRGLAALVLVLSLVAIALGGYGVVAMFRASRNHFEGYLLLMGVILLGHGAVALVYTALTSALARRTADA